MGNQYEADKIIQLLQFCSWKAHTTMNNSGLIELTSKLGQLPGVNEKYPNNKYLVDLLSDAKSAIKHDNIIRRRKSYIDLLLEYSGYKSWKDWRDHLAGPIEYLKSENFSSVSSEQNKIAVLIPESLGKQLRPLIIQIQKAFPYELEYFFYDQEKEESSVKQELSQLNDYHFIIWIIPISWSKIKVSTWQELTESSSIIPIWVDQINIWETEIPFISFLKQKEIIGGAAGILCSLLLIKDYFLTTVKPEESKDDRQKPVSNIQHFHDNSSGFITQGNIQNQNNTIQTITNYHSKG